MTDLTQIAVPNEGPITDKVKEIYERSFPPEEQIPLPELLKAAELPEVSFVAWVDQSHPAGEDGSAGVVALTFSFVFPDLFYLGFLAVDGSARSAGYGSRSSLSSARPGTTSSACDGSRSTNATVLR